MGPKLTGMNGQVTHGSEAKFEREYSAPQTSNRKTKSARLKKNMKRINDQYSEAVKSAAATELLLQEEAGFLEAEGMEKTYKFKQQDILKEVDVQTQAKAIDLKLTDFGPYTLDYSRNGTHLLIGGLKGHVASMDWRKGTLSAELQLGETVNAVKYLQNEQFFAVAQKKYTFIYDHEGVEIHRMKQHVEVKNLEFLPYHYLLATSGNTGWLKYQDVSTGVLVNEIRTKLGPSVSMAQNPYNAIIELGSANGVVSMWSPASNEPLVKIQACRGPVRSISCDRSGKYMAVAGADKTLKIWDIRNFKELYSYYTPTLANDIAFSDTGLLNVAWGSHVTVWKDCYKSKQNSPYMTHLIPGSTISAVRPVPFEDLVGVGHKNGVKNLIVPGAGEANFDSLEINPYESIKQRQEQEVRSLLNKLPADSIALDPNVIGTVDTRSNSERLNAKRQKELAEQKQAELNEKLSPHPEIKGKNSKLRNYLRKKRENVIDERKLRIEANLKREKELRREKMLKETGQHVDEKEALGPALSRFT